jgi:serine/threonine-protein kinase
MIGETLLHYKVSEKIGAGGMGEVYRARDDKLGRDVALKILPEALARDHERLARFDREAKLLASLNHANIGAIYGLEKSGSRRFLVLELVEGEDLAQRLSRGPVRTDDALKITRQVAEALEAAHDRGIIHRDLKPANIKVSPDGTVKVLDFGLAKALDDEAHPGDPGISQSPTLIASGTVQGVILGTAAYMSPEQARGKTVDRRADIFAFGCVLYEMLTGHRLFTGETVSDTLAAVLRADPDWSALPPETPRLIVRLLQRCLTKDPRRRLRDIGEARIVIEDVVAGEGEPDESPIAPADTPPGRSVIPIAVTAVLTAVIAAAAVWSFKPGPPEQPLRKIGIAVTTENDKPPGVPKISPDGTRIAYVNAGQLWIRDLSELEPRAVATTETNGTPFWSPDGAWLGYTSGGNIYKVPVEGGKSMLVCETKGGFDAAAGVTWSEDGRIVFGHATDHLFVVSSAGGDPRVFLEVDEETESDYHQPCFLPGGEALIFVRHRLRHGPDTITLLTDGVKKDLITIADQNLWNPAYSPTGHVLYRRMPDNAGLWALPFSLERLEATGQPFLVSPEADFPSVSSDGTMVYLTGAAVTMRELVWVDHKQNVEEIPGEPVASINSISLSPDERFAAVSANEGGNRDVWIHDLARGTRTRLTFENDYETVPVWSPSGDHIAYRNDAESAVMIKASDGSGTAVFAAEGNHPSFSPDGRYLLYTRNEEGVKQDIWYVALDEDGDPVRFMQTPAEELYPRLSPDGRYVLYRSDESGRNEIYIKRFPTGEGKWQVSNNGASWPRWSRNGDFIYYREVTRLMEVSVELEPTVRLGTPRLVLDMNELDLQYWSWTSFDVAADGRFIFGRQIRDEDDDGGMVLVENWFSEFRNR